MAPRLVGAPTPVFVAGHTGQAYSVTANTEGFFLYDTFDLGPSYAIEFWTLRPVTR
jgi:hypothetical protein